AADAGEALVDDEALAHVRDVALRDVRRDAELNLRLDVGLPLLPAQLAHRLLEQVRVELEADGRDVPRLLLAEEVAGAPDLEVVRRQPEAAAQIVQLLQDAQPFLGVGGDQVLAGDQQVGVGAMMRAADAPADLVELGQPEGVGTVHDDRVGARDVEARLDDRRRHEDIGLPVHERGHGVLQRALAHLYMYHADARLRDDLTGAPGDVLTEAQGDVVDVLDPVVDEEQLAATAQLTEHGVADDALVVARDVGTDGEPIDGWRLDDAQVADAGEGHVEGARDRRGGERQ